MKIHIKLILFIYSFSFLVSCFEDKGNYEYADINIVSITNGGDSLYYVVSKLDTLKIYPRIMGTLDEDADNNSGRYSYKWSVGDIKTKNLIYPVDLAAGQYNISVTVKDNITELITSASWKVEVGSLYQKGFIILTENEKKNAQLDMISLFGEDTISIKDIIVSRDMPPVKNPKKLFIGVNRNNSEINIIGENETLKVDKNKFTYNPITGNLVDNFVNPKQFEIFNVTHIVDPTTYRAIIVNGDLYSASTYIPGYLFVYPMNRYPKKHDLFKVADQLAINYKYATEYGKETDKIYVLYNMDESRFVYLKRNGTTLDSLKDTKADVDIFKWQTGLTHVATTHSYFGIGDNFTLLKDNVGGYFLYQYSYRGGMMATLPKKIGKYDMSDAPNIANAKYFCFSANHSFVFYASGTKIYGYDYRKNVATFEMDMGGEVTCIYDSPHKAYEGGRDFLYIASYAGSPLSGKIVKKHIINNPNLIGLEDPINSDGVSHKVEWTGLNKVIDLLYKQ